MRGAAPAPEHDDAAAGVRPSAGERAPRQRPAPPPEFFCVDRNVATLGLFTASHSRILRTEPKTVVVARNDGPVRRFATATIVPASGYGLPVTADQDRYFALLHLLFSRKRGAQLPANRIEFCTAELLHSLELCADSGKHYRDVRHWLDVMTMTTIVSDEAVYLADRKCYVRDRFRVFDRAVYAGEVLEDGTTADRHYIWLSEWQRANLTHEHVVLLDLARYRQLTRPIARALVPFMPIWMRVARERGVFVKRYSDICGVLGLRRYAHPSKIREKFGPALDELTSAGYVADWTIDANKEGDDFNLGLRAPAQDRPKAQRSPAPAATPPSRPADPVIEELVARGIARHAAAKLIAQLPAGQDVARHLAWFDRLMQSPAGRAVRNPAGFLYRAIESDAAVPDVRVPGPAEPTELDLAISARKQLREAYERYAQQEVQAYIANLPADTRAVLQKAAHDELLREFPSLRHSVPDALDGPSRARLEQQLRRELPLKSLADFAREQSDARSEAEAAS